MAKCRKYPYASVVVSRPDLYVALVATGVDPAVSNGVFHGTKVFVRVCAIGETAAAHVRAELAKVPGNLFGNHVPKLELADAGRVHDIAAEGKGNKLRRR